MNISSLSNIDSLYNYAQQQVQADIVADKFWMWFDPWAAIACMSVALLVTIGIVVSLVIANKSSDYEYNYAEPCTAALLTTLIIAVLCASGFMGGYLAAKGDYNYKTTAPAAATYEKVVDYLYRGT